MKFPLFLIFFMANWITWIAPMLVYGDWSHKATSRTESNVLHSVVYQDADGSLCGEYYLITPEMMNIHTGQYSTYTPHDPWARLRRDNGYYQYPLRYYPTETQARQYLEKWCKI